MNVRLYAVLRLRPRPRAGTALPGGVQGERLKILKGTRYSLAVADARGALEPAVENLLEFDRVIRELAELSVAILPARFGSVMPSAAALKSEIAERAGPLAAALDKVAGRVQMTVRIPAGSSHRPGPFGPGKGSAYLHSRAAVSRPPALTKLRKALADLVRDERVEPGPAGTSVYHLIARGDVAEYLARLSDLRASGPFPPYAFVPGIDPAVWPGYDDKNTKPAKGGSARPRAGR